MSSCTNQARLHISQEVEFDGVVCRGSGKAILRNTTELNCVMFPLLPQYLSTFSSKAVALSGSNIASFPNKQ